MKMQPACPPTILFPNTLCSSYSAGNQMKQKYMFLAFMDIYLNPPPKNTSAKIQGSFYEKYFFI
jgi:hypothetical protein